jgi:hypothetical protein
MHRMKSTHISSLRPRALGNRGHPERGYLMGPSPCDTGQQSNGVTVQDNAC